MAGINLAAAQFAGEPLVATTPGVNLAAASLVANVNAAGVNLAAAALSVVSGSAGINLTSASLVTFPADNGINLAEASLMLTGLNAVTVYTDAPSVRTLEGFRRFVMTGGALVEVL